MTDAFSLDFDALAASAKNTSIDQVSQEIDDVSKAKGQSEFWSPKTDKAGNAVVEGRFLPKMPGEKGSFVQFKHYSFKGPTGKRYYEKALTVLGLKDPVAEANSALYNSGDDAKKKIASSRTQKMDVVAYFLILQAENEPERVGTVVEYKFGKQVFEKITGAMNPKFAGDPRINPFDIFDSGANFRIVQKEKGGWPNYEDSSWGPISSLYGGDQARMRKVFDGLKLKPLSRHIDPSSFKSYDELKARFREVWGDGEFSGPDTDEAAPPKTAGQAIDRSIAEPKQERTAEAPPFTPDAPKSTNMERAAPKSEDNGVDFFRQLAKKAEAGNTP